MRINVVAKLGWILERLARELKPIGATINCGQRERKADPEADFNYYMPARDFLKFPVRGRAVGLFTHGPTAFEIAHRFDVCVTMNRAMSKALDDPSRPAGSAFEDYPVAKPQRVETICPGTEPPARPPRFGVSGRVYGKARKGAHLVAKAVEAGFDFRACSDAQSRRGEAPCSITHAIKDRVAFYGTIDYLVVTSTDEGGPMPVLEAIAHHVPVIAPDVGFCWEFPVIRYRRGSWPSLKAVLLGLTEVPTWKGWADAHKRLFEELLNGRQPS